MVTCVRQCCTMEPSKESTQHLQKIGARLCFSGSNGDLMTSYGTDVLLV